MDFWCQCQVYVFSKYLLNAFYVSGSGLEADITQIKSLPYGVYIPIISKE